MIVEPVAGDRVEDNLNPVGRASSTRFSTLLCTPVSLSQDVGLALGAQAGPARIAQVVTEAGFSRFRQAAETPVQPRLRGATVSANATAGNREAVEAWDGVLFDRFARFRHIILPGLGAHGDRGLELHPPQPGERVLDIGSGFGDTTRQMAAMVGPRGEAVGVDASPRFTHAARAEAEQAAVANARFAVADVEAGGLGGGYDRAFSRFGTTFFANPVRALRNVRAALVPGGELCMVVWRQKPDNPWLYAAERAVERILERREDSDQPTCGPGPFSMANADTTSGILISAGFEDIRFVRCDTQMLIGRDLDEAIDYVMAIGPAAEIIRLAGEDADPIRRELRDTVRGALEPFDRTDGVHAQMSTWIVSARAGSSTGAAELAIHQPASWLPTGAMSSTSGRHAGTITPWSSVTCAPSSPSPGTAR